MPPLAAHNLALIALQYELALSVGQDLRLDVMLRRFFTPALKLLGCGSAHVWRDGVEPDRPTHVFAYPLRESILWVDRPGWREAVERFDGHCKRSTVAMPDGLVLHLFDLPRFGRAMMVRDGRTLAPDTLMALEPIMDRLATACLACVQYESLEMLRQKAEAANQAKSHFLANMSHEIRTPITGVIGLTELALEDSRDAVLRGHLEVVLDSARHLLGIVNEILDFSKIDAGRIELSRESLDVRDLLDSVVSAMRPNAQLKGLQLEAVVPESVPWVVGDPLRLRQVLYNLTGNAIKFTSTGRVTLSAQLSMPADGEPGNRVWVRFSVKDTGIGIPADKIQHVFDAFSQADESTSRVYGGTGLGLTISRKLVALMGGRITVNSVPGEGSEFGFEVGLQRASPPTRREEVSLQTGDPAASSRPLQVLVVDDVPTNRLLVGKLLERSGHLPVFASDGSEALERVQEQDFDGVFMDMQMPVMDGLEATRLIRAWEQEQGRSPLYIVALTANAMPADERRCRDVGMNAYLSKPIRRTAFDVLLQQMQANAPASSRFSSKTGGG